jgi:DNA-binding beta-propeller fold protein YncE
MPIRPALAAAGAALAVLAAAAAASAAPAYSVTGSIPGPDGGWDYATFDPALRRLYVTHADAVFAVDVDTGKVTPKLGDAPHSHKVVPLDGGRTLLVTVGAINGARFIDAHTGATLADVATGKGPDGAVYDPATGRVAVADHAGGDVVLIDPATRRAAGTIQVGGTLEEAVPDGKGRLFVNVEDKNEIAVLDEKTLAVTQKIELEGCDGPGGLVFAPRAGVMIAACGNGKAAVVNARTGALEKLLDIGKGPDAALYDPKRRLVLIPCGGSGELTLIDASGPDRVQVVGSVATERGARTGALDPKTGKVYLPAARFGPAPAGQRRGPMEPGSFHIVVVSPAS